jgi:hypothetical protein
VAAWSARAAATAAPTCGRIGRRTQTAVRSDADAQPKPQAQPQPDRRRALALLAGSPDGAPEAVLLAHGFKLDLLVDLVRDGLATATADRMRAGKREMEITRVRITEEGRRALTK